MRRSKGFTLIEILIVIMILAILASLVLPRILGQVERAKYAEAFAWMGVLRRGAEKMYTLTGQYTGLIYSKIDNSYVAGSSWETLELKDPGGLKKWNLYYLGSGTSCDIWVWDNWSYTNYMEVVASAGSEVWTCVGLFKPVTKAGKVVGCTL